MIEALDQALGVIADSRVATALRYSRWGYASVNTAHVLGIAMLVGSIIPLDLKLLGVWRSAQREPLVRVLIPTAAAGLSVAIATGVLLFSVRPADYVTLSVFQLKIALIAAGALSAMLIHLKHGLRLEGASHRQLARAAALSMTCWLGALIAGRMIAFAAD